MTAALTTPDRRYIVVRGRLWRASNPDLPEVERQAQVDRLMAARRAVRAANDDAGILRDARLEVDAAKTGLGERGSVWWDDGSPDYNQHLVKNTPYAQWHASTAGAT